MVSQLSEGKKTHTERENKLITDSLNFFFGNEREKYHTVYIDVCCLAQATYQIVCSSTALIYTYI